MNCSICLETFLNPRILLCGHTFCEECLKKSIVNYNLSCPTCRYKHKSMKVEDYPKNYILIELIEKMKQDQVRARSKSKSKANNHRSQRSKHYKSKKGSMQWNENHENIDSNKPVPNNQANSNPLKDYQNDMIKLHEPMEWFNISQYLNQLVFTYFFCSISLAVITIVFNETSNDIVCRSQSQYWIWINISSHLAHITWYFYLLNSDSTGKTTDGLKIVYIVSVIIMSLMTIAIGYITFTECLEVQEVLILGISNIVFNVIVNTFNWLQIIKYSLINSGKFVIESIKK